MVERRNGSLFIHVGPWLVEFCRGWEQCVFHVQQLRGRSSSKEEASSARVLTEAWRAREGVLPWWEPPTQEMMENWV